MKADVRIRDIIFALVETIKQKYQPEKIILYGSYAYGKPNAESDIDFLIIKDTPERAIERRVTVRRLVDIRDADHPSFCPLVVTPAELKGRLAIGDHFFEKIMNEGEVLYGH
jgi:predicted nucleotidyltransferase